MSVNRFIGIGNITRDAEVRTVGQQQVAKFGLAMSEKYRKNDGTIGENTEFINVELWGQAGVHQYLVKGQMIYVDGSIKTDKWQGQDGQWHYETKVRAFSVQLIGARPQQQAPAQPQAPAYQQPQQPAAPKYPAAPQYQAPAQPQYAPQAPQAPQYPAAPEQSGADPDLPF